MGKELILERLVLLRKRANLSCKELSEKINRQETYISRVEKGKYPIPPAEDLERIANACGSSMEELFYEDFDKYSEDKAVREQLKELTGDSKSAVIGLLVLLHKQSKELNKNKDSLK